MNENKKILIVDDDEGIRESLKLILSDHYALILTGNGAQALDCLKNDQSIQCVLLDIKLPQNNGLDVLKAIKEKRPDCRIIIVTGYKSVETATEAANLGADGYIVKPFKDAEILETVNRVMPS